MRRPSAFAVPTQGLTRPSAPVVSASPDTNFCLLGYPAENSLLVYDMDAGKGTDFLTQLEWPKRRISYADVDRHVQAQLESVSFTLDGRYVLLMKGSDHAITARGRTNVDRRNVGRENSLRLTVPSLPRTESTLSSRPPRGAGSFDSTTFPVGCDYPCRTVPPGCYGSASQANHHDPRGGLDR